MNPVRAGMVEHPGDYKWSSYRVNAYAEKGSEISSHALYLNLSFDKDKRLESYRHLFQTDLDNDQLHVIRRSIQFSMPVGDNRFVEEIERIVGRNIGYAKRGRSMIKEEQGIYLVW